MKLTDGCDQHDLVANRLSDKVTVIDGRTNRAVQR